MNGIKGFQKGHPFYPGTDWNKGKKLSSEACANMSAAAKGVNTWMKGRKLSEATKAKMSTVRKGRKLSLEHRKRISEGQSGPRSRFWKGGLTAETVRIRNTLDYRLWRSAVYERDNYICQECGIRGGTLNADHIKPFSLFPDLRFSVDNGRTLCHPCHRKTDTYGVNIKNYTI